MEPRFDESNPTSSASESPNSTNGPPGLPSDPASDSPAAPTDPFPVLSKTYLTLAFIAVAVIPMTIVTALVYGLEWSQEPTLDASLEVAPRPWAIPGSDEPPRVMPCLVITNTSDGTLDNLSFTLNKEFYYYHRGILNAGEELVVPLKIFGTRGNQGFLPQKYEVEQVIFFAQLPNKARGVLEKEFTAK